MLDPRVFEFVNFQAQFVQPLFVAKYNIDPGAIDSQKFLLDTRNGLPLNSSNIRKTSANWFPMKSQNST